MVWFLFIAKINIIRIECYFTYVKCRDIFIYILKYYDKLVLNRYLRIFLIQYSNLVPLA